MIKTASVQARHIFAAYCRAMAQAAYLRRHGYLRDHAVIRVEEWVAAAAPSNRAGAQPAEVSAKDVPDPGELAQER